MRNLECSVLRRTCCALFLLSSFADAATFTLVPISASGAHTIVGNKIRLDGGGQRVVLELRLSDWGPDHLRSWQARIDSEGYANGVGASLTPADEECSTHPECFATFGHGSLCIYPYSIGGHCSPAFIDRQRADWVHLDQDSFVNADVSLGHPAGFLFFAITDRLQYATDDGNAKYGGTLIIDVPADAAGDYKLDFVDDPGHTFMADEDNHSLPNLTVLGALITILCDSHTDCDDGIACTADTCEVDECTNVPACASPDDCCETNADCGDVDVCPVNYCNSSGCCTLARECRSDDQCGDADPCTQDFCMPDGCCQHLPNCRSSAECLDGDPCTLDSCSPDGCCVSVFQCVTIGDCDDGDPCTLHDCTPDGCCEYVLAQDDDGDGIANDCDLCPNTPPDTAVNGVGRPLGDQDGDCDTDLADFRQFIIMSNDLQYYRLLYQGLTGPLP